MSLNKKVHFVHQPYGQAPLHHFTLSIPSKRIIRFISKGTYLPKYIIYGAVKFFQNVINTILFRSLFANASNITDFFQHIPNTCNFVHQPTL